MYFVASYPPSPVRVQVYLTLQDHEQLRSRRRYFRCLRLKNLAQEVAAVSLFRRQYPRCVIIVGRPQCARFGPGARIPLLLLMGSN
ncbi:uncharacterized protein PHALS_14513 [Plasmopara halstedii]|uniref:Uncharacterized protein n=1 Tax=Plasmopara halstedii TaxID=4781 RepID=A0A0N7L5E2_PLAHL|nr:uncharacterized protein PHALS_14513 [Plasmopara halstedii]CEG41227.1 hypothetical protein PHALS_14513 [Plasmopara halstedii]|eukprot:XP_024577596.1 hypothetical protein PHALS_14513 [Plasmopara halstedii]